MFINGTGWNIYLGFPRPYETIKAYVDVIF